MIPVYIIGLGMSLKDLPAARLERIRSADILAGGDRHLEYFPDFKGEKIRLGKDLDSAIALIGLASRVKQVVVLASGDPGFYGIGRRLAEALGAKNVIVEPNVTAHQVAFSRIRTPWNDATVVSLHGRGWDQFDATLPNAEKLAVYTAPGFGPSEIATHLIERGRLNVQMCVLEDLGSESEKVTWLRPHEAAQKTFSSLNVVILLIEDALGEPSHRLHLGMPEEAYEHEDGLITKAEVRAVALSKLAPGPKQTLWDIGAGSGSLGIEASLLMPGGRIFAVERDPKRAEHIRINRDWFGVKNLEIISAEAPGCLGDLPDPDRVFVGGGGSGIRTVLETVMKRIRPGGRVVVTAALLETLNTTKETLEQGGFAVEFVQIQINRGRPMKAGTRFEPLTPIWIVTGRSGTEGKSA